MQGGPAFTVLPSGVPSAGGGIAWGDDDQLYFVNERGAIQRVSPAGGVPATVSEPAREVGFMWIDALPATRHLLATIGRVGVPEASEIVAVSTTDGTVQPLVRGTMGRYATSGHLVYATADGALMAVPFDAKALKVTDKPTALFRGVDVYMGSASQFALSRSGGLVWVGYGGLREMLLVDRRGVSRPADSGWVADIRAFALSPDGTRLLVTTADVGGLRVGIKPLGSGPLSPLALEGTRNVGLTWTHDGQSIGVLSDRDGAGALWRVPADGAGRATRLPVTGSLFSAEWSANGGALVATRASPGARSEIIGLRPVSTVRHACWFPAPFSSNTPYCRRTAAGWHIRATRPAVTKCTCDRFRRATKASGRCHPVAASSRCGHRAAERCITARRRAIW